MNRPGPNAQPGGANPASPVNAAALHLRALTAQAPPDTFLDVRYRTPGRAFARFFLAVHAPDAARTLIRLGRQADVYVGCAPRTRHRGRREDIAPTPLLWADCDTPDAIAALARFRPAPTMIVASGSGEAPHPNAHAYWALTSALPIDQLENANRRLAAALGADPKCADATRILRVPGTLNFKHNPPRPVQLVAYTDARHRPTESLTALPPLPVPTPQANRPPAPEHGVPGDPLLRIAPTRYVPTLTGRTPDRDGKIHCPLHQLSVGEATAGGVSPAHSLADASLRDCVPADPLLLVPPPVYFERMTGLRVGRSGKLRCLFHDDRSPSLHVYREAGRGWYCFGCGRGGSVYDLAALLWLSGQSADVPLRGRQFVEVRRRLLVMFLGEDAAA
jgi:hypothetical protein